MVYAPGKDRVQTGTSAGWTPRQGAGGVHAGYIQGQTSKFARNAGLRKDQFRETLARLFVRVDAGEMDLFLSSFADEHVRTQLASRIAGDPVNRAADRVTAGGDLSQSETRTNRTASTTGYLDFFIQQANMPLMEKFDVKETLADNFSAEFFGQQPPMWSFTGWLMNTVQDDQATNFLRLYLQVLRGTMLARRQKVVSLRFDSYIVTGDMTMTNLSLSSQAQTYVPFAFTLLVKRIGIITYTEGWVPTRAGTAFAADPNAIPYDGRPSPVAAQRQIAASLPANLEDAAPTNAVVSDPRTRQRPVTPDALMPPPAPEPEDTNPDLATSQSIASVLSPLFVPTPLLGLLAAADISARAHSLIHTSVDRAPQAALTVPRPETQNPPRRNTTAATIRTP